MIIYESLWGKKEGRLFQKNIPLNFKQSVTWSYINNYYHKDVGAQGLRPKTHDE